MKKKKKQILLQFEKKKKQLKNVITWQGAGTRIEPGQLKYWYVSL